MDVLGAPGVQDRFLGVVSGACGRDDGDEACAQIQGGVVAVEDLADGGYCAELGVLYWCSCIWLCGPAEMASDGKSL